MARRSALRAARRDPLRRAAQGLGLTVDPGKPLVAVVSRLVNQKNPALMAVSPIPLGTEHTRLS